MHSHLFDDISAYLNEEYFPPSVADDHPLHQKQQCGAKYSSYAIGKEFELIKQQETDDTHNHYSSDDDDMLASVLYGPVHKFSLNDLEATPPSNNSNTPTVPSPAVSLPVVPLPTVPLPTVPSPTVFSPTVSSPVVPLPTVPLPTVPLPAVPLPAVSSPAVPLPTVSSPTAPPPAVTSPSPAVLQPSSSLNGAISPSTTTGHIPQLPQATGIRSPLPQYLAPYQQNICGGQMAIHPSFPLDFSKSSQQQILEAVTKYGWNITGHGPEPCEIRFAAAALKPPAHTEFEERIRKMTEDDEERMAKKKQQRITLQRRRTALSECWKKS
jgi:hypothetical protein